HYHQIMERKGVSPETAKREVRRQNTLVGALMVKRGEADGMICGTFGQHATHLGYVKDVLGLRKNVHLAAAMSMLLHPKGTFFICDTYVNSDPTAEEIAEITQLAAEEVQRFGITPKVALLSHSSFG